MEKNTIWIPAQEAIWMQEWYKEMDRRIIWGWMGETEEEKTRRINEEIWRKYDISKWD